MADKPEAQRVGISGFHAFGAMGAARKAKPAPSPAPKPVHFAVQWNDLLPRVAPQAGQSVLGLVGMNLFVLHVAPVAQKSADKPQDKPKPPPQKLGVNGFQVFGAMGQAARPASGATDFQWKALARNPRFQLFIWQRCKGPADADWHLWAQQRIPLEIKSMGEQAFFDAWLKWRDDWLAKHTKRKE